MAFHAQVRARIAAAGALDKNEGIVKAARPTH